MIKLTRLDQSDILINPDLIEHIELNSNTVITLINGRSFVVKEGWDEIQSRVIEFRRRCSHLRRADPLDFKPDFRGAR